MAKSKLIYWDSCAFIHYFQKTKEYVDALAYIEGQAKDGEAKIVTCAVSIVEVCKLPELGMLPIEQTRKILRYMENDYIDIWQADRLICEEAHHIVRLHKLKPMDAIHISVALAAQKVELMVTTDTKKYRRDGLLAMNGKIGNPPLRIMPPTLGVVLPLWEATDDSAKETRESDG